MHKEILLRHQCYLLTLFSFINALDIDVHLIVVILCIFEVSSMQLSETVKLYLSKEQKDLLVRTMNEYIHTALM